MINKVKEYVMQKLHDGNVRVHFSKVDYPKDHPYDVLCGVYVDNKLSEVFEFENTTNEQIEEYMVELNSFVKQNTLYLI